VPANKVVDFEAALHAYARSNAKPLLDKINAEGQYTDEVVAGLKSLIEGFKTTGAY
jgi:F-type H+-transporting ATPase subunit alpha